MKATANTFIYLNGNLRAWMGAVFGTIGLNLALFAIIPILMHPNTAPQRLDTLIPQINLIRIKRQEDPPRKKTQIIKENQPKAVSPKPSVKQSFSRPLALPFKVNTRLPGGQGTLELPVINSNVLDSLDLNTLFGPQDLDQPLTILTRMPPIYPFNAKSRGIEGWVKIRLVVNEQGGVEDIQILSAKPKKIFDDSVIRCVSAWRFRPGSIDGLPVKTQVETSIRFELN